MQMAQIDADKKLIAPLLDRLLDDNPSAPHDFTQGQHLLLNHLRESVRRDLEKLFNSRQCCLTPPQELDHLQGALPNYGLPDAATLNLHSQKARLDFCRTVEEAVRRFEPRIRSVKVFTQSAIDPEDPSIRFRVEAMLYAVTTEELIIFDSALNPVTRSVTVQESRK